MTTITVQTREFAHALANVVQFTTTEVTKLDLWCVQMQHRPGQLMAAACDRHALATHRVYAETDTAGSVLLSHQNVRHLVKAAKDAAATCPLASVTITATSVTLTLTSREFSVSTEHGKFPGWSRFFLHDSTSGDETPSHDGPTPAFALASRYLAKLAKVDSGGLPVALRMPATPGKPVLAVTGDFTALIGPVRQGAWPWDTGTWQPPSPLPLCGTCGQCYLPEVQPCGCPDHAP